MSFGAVEEPKTLAWSFVSGGNDIYPKSSLALLFKRRGRWSRVKDMPGDDPDAAHVIGGADEQGRASPESFHKVPGKRVCGTLLTTLTCIHLLRMTSDLRLQTEQTDGRRTTVTPWRDWDGSLR